MQENDEIFKDLFTVSLTLCSGDIPLLKMS